MDGCIGALSADKAVITARIKSENAMLAKGQLLIADKHTLDKVLVVSEYHTVRFRLLRRQAPRICLSLEQSRYEPRSYESGMVYSSTHSALNVQEGRKERRESRRLSDKASELSIQADNELAEQR